MSDTVIRVEKISKLYRLGEVGTGSLAHDVNRWWHKVRGKEDPYLKIGEVNDRTKPAAWAVASSELLVTSENQPRAEPERRGCAEEGGRRQARRASRVGRTANQIAPQAPSDWVYALKDVSFEVKAGELRTLGRSEKEISKKCLGATKVPDSGRRRHQLLGIIGRNGANQIHFAEILSRVTTQSSGQIKVTQAAWEVARETAEGSPQGEMNGSQRINGRIASLLEVGTGFHPELTGREPEGWEARRTSKRRLARRVQRRRGGANQNIFLNGAILGMRKAEPKRWGGAEEGCRR